MFTQLDTEFFEGYVVHRTYQLVGIRDLEIRSKWSDIRIVGKGGFGVVWLQKEDGGQLRAVKRTNKTTFDRGITERLLSGFLPQLKNEFLVNHFGWYQNSDFYFLAMEYIEHGNLSQYITLMGKGCNARAISRQILEGLSFLHGLDVVHRDINPQNVMIYTPSPLHVKIIGFSISKSTRGTELRTLAGTPGYMAPEIAGLLPRNFRRVSTFSSAVDIWGLGIVVHKVLTLEIAFKSLPMEFEGSDDISIDLDDLDDNDTVDMTLLYSYCRGETAFPLQKMKECQVSKNGLEFVESLLAADPADRPTAMAALQSQWFLEKDAEVDEVILSRFMQSRNNIPCEVKETSTFKEEAMIGRYRLEPTSNESWVQKATLAENKISVILLHTQQGSDGVERLRVVKRSPRDIGRVNRFQELRALAEVHREDLFVQFIGWFEDAYFTYIAMEYLPLGDLSQFLERYKLESKRNAKQITRQLLTAIAFLHKKGICHRDMKPHNILIASRNPIKVKLADFGASKCGYSEEAKLVTRVGTLGYFSPEILGLIPRYGSKYTVSMDIWGLGCIVYEILTSQKPFLEPSTALGVESFFLDSCMPTIHPSSNIDMQLLLEYCLGKIEFPLEILLEAGASADAIEFLKHLLAAHPRSRPSADEALQDPWLSPRHPE